LGTLLSRWDAARHEVRRELELERIHTTYHARQLEALRRQSTFPKARN
jgi:hypothetical protein